MELTPQILLKEKYSAIARSSPVWMGHLFFVVLIIFSAAFYAIRGTLTDNAVYLFNMVNEEDFFTPHNRYGAAITQALPLLLVKMHLSLKAVMVGYSIASSLLCYILFIVCMHGFRNVTAAWTLVATFAFGMFHYFSWPCSEVQQGLPWVALYIAVFHWAKQRGVVQAHLTTLLFGAWLNLFHPLLMFPLFFITGYEWLNDKSAGILNKLTALGLSVLPFVLRVILFPPDVYEAERMLTMDKLVYGLTHFFSLKTTQSWLESTLIISFKTLLLLVFTAVMLIRLRKRLSLAWCLLCFAGYFVFITISNPQEDALFYMSNNYLFLTLFFAYPLAREVISKPGNGVSLLFCAVVFFFFFKDLRERNGFYKTRLAYEQVLIEHTEKYPERKFTMDAESSFARDHIFYNWAYAYETLMLSALQGADNCKMILVKDERARPEATKLNPEYFRLRELGYRHLTEEELSGLQIKKGH